MQLETGTFILVSDAGRALILENRGDGAHLDLRVIRVMENENPPARELASGPPGRFRTPAGGYAATEQTDWHNVAETRFLEDVARETLQVAGAKAPAHLVIAADPKSLGRLRLLLADSGTVQLLGEIQGDLVHQTIASIEQAVAAA